MEMQKLVLICVFQIWKINVLRKSAVSQQNHLSKYLTLFYLMTFLFYQHPLTHSAREYFEKLALKKTTKNATLNGCISKARANSESKLTFSESSLNFLQNRVVFCTLYPHEYTAGGSASYNPWCRCQRLAGLKELKEYRCKFKIGTI